MSKSICVIGLGYIGLPTASMFATHGYKVTGVDVNEQIIQKINNGSSHIEEKGLNTLVRAAVLSQNLTASKMPSEADAFIICVPTPINTSNCTSNLNYVRSAAESIVPYLREGALVILESTSPPGTVNDLLIPIIEKSGFKAGSELFIAHCPERVLPGKILEELVQNDRIIGGINEESAKRARDLYRSFVSGNIYLTDSTTAEMCKLMENTYRDVNIALANELTIISEKLGINIWEAIELVNKHPRVNIHQPGPGVGGHCIPVDPWFIVEAAPEEARLITLSRHINDGMAEYLQKIIEETIGNTGTIAIFGVAYKGNVDDARETPSLNLAELLLSSGYDVRFHDPQVKNFKYKLDDFCSSVDGADMIVVVTDHNEYKNIDTEMINKFSEIMNEKNIIDTRNCLYHELWKKSGFNVRVLGNSPK
ncbi:MAG: nucleotide sugar dehydrogenase [Methanosarcinaceae archaeon]|nr:nucleotide sugar dehydrogenase [Methanosarcinaceae archaeon]